MLSRRDSYKLSSFEKQPPTVVAMNPLETHPQIPA